LPDERTVVSCVVEVVGAGTFLVVVCVVVVLAGTGFSTTVVHEVNRAVATATSGVRMMSFFIVGIVFLQGQIGAGPSARCISGQDF
jgi:hypothetical protein